MVSVDSPSSVRPPSIGSMSSRVELVELLDVLHDIRHLRRVEHDLFVCDLKMS